jgi:hypothetical protein
MPLDPTIAEVWLGWSQHTCDPTPLPLHQHASRVSTFLTAPTVNHVATLKANGHELLSLTDDVTQHHESCRNTEGAEDRRMFAAAQAQFEAEQATAATAAGGGGREGVSKGGGEAAVR